MTSPSVFIKNAELRYHNQFLFKDLNFTLKANQLTCLLGPSGVGKTSLLQMIAGLIKTDFVHTDNNTEAAQQVSFLFQTDALLPWLSIIDNVLLGYKLRSKANFNDLHEKAILLLSSMGLKQSLNKKTYELSGGMRQRVALARTLMENRPIVLMDEPFSALDAITRHEMQNLVIEHLHNKTVLLVTHDPLEALRIADEIYVMSGQPACIKQAIHLSSKKPRKLDDQEIRDHYSNLMNQLSQEVGYEAC